MTTAAASPFTGRKMLLVLLAFFGVIIAVNAVMMTLAIGSHTGLVAKNSYVASQDFNRTVAKAKAQTAMGWQAGLAARPTSLELTFKDKSGRPIEGLAIDGVVGRIVTGAEDQAVRFEALGGGVYRAEIASPPGQARLDIQAMAVDGTVFQRAYRYWTGARGG